MPRPPLVALLSCLALTANAARAEVLWDQTANQDGTGVTSQQFEVGMAAWDNEAADDFVVPGADGGWMVTRLFVPGEYTIGPMVLLDVAFYADAGGLPGALVHEVVDTLSFSDDGGTLTIDLTSAPALLPPGTYWVSVRADMDFDPNGQWYWNVRTVQAGAGAAWRNPSDGWAVGCTSWTNRVSCGMGTAPDQAFRLEGSKALWNQTDHAAGTAVASQDFEDAHSGYDCEAADDFVVAGGPWRIEFAAVPGVYIGGPTPLVDVYFHSTGAGLPDEPVHQLTNLDTFIDIGGTLWIDLTADPAVLEPGVYWFSALASMDSAAGQWYWTERTVVSGSPSAWRNPGGAFGTACAGWGARAAHCYVGGNPDLAFLLGGTPLGVFGDGFESGNWAAWSFTQP